MILKNTLLKNLVVAAILGASGVAQAGNSLDLNKWSTDFENALKSNKVSAAKQMLDINALKKIAIPKCVDCESKETLKKARLAFEKKQYAKSIDLYNQIPKSSEYWFEAVEERGWAHFNNQDTEKAIAQTKTLISPQFGEIVNTEAYFLRSLAQLRICDYQGIFGTTQTFKDRQRERVLAVREMAKSGMNSAVNQSLSKINSFPIKRTEIAESLLKSPTLYYKDLDVQEQMLRFKVAERALAVLSGKLGFENLRSTAENMKSSSLNKLSNRLQVLAKQEDTINTKIVQKLNLIEVEAIQRVHTDMKLAEELYSEQDFKETNTDKLVFMDDGRPWIDELDKYEVISKSCPNNLRRKM